MRTDLPDRLEFEAQAMLDRGLVTRGQRIVVRNVLVAAADEIRRLRQLLEAQ